MKRGGRVWPGRPSSAHWGLPDPAAFVGTERDRRAVFLRIDQELPRRIDAFVRRLLGSFDREALRARLDEIAATGGQVEEERE